MKIDDADKTKEQLIQELTTLRQQIGKLETTQIHHKKTEKSQDISEKSYQSLFDSVPIGLYRSTPEGKFTDVNPAFVKMLGYPDQETLKAIDAIDLYVEPTDREKWQASLEQSETVPKYPKQFRRYDGTLIWVESSARVIRDSNGQILYYEGAAQDMTERKQTEIALQRSEIRYRTFFENAPIGISLSVPRSQVMKINDAFRPIFVFENTKEFRGSQVLMVNEAFEQLYGYSQEEINQMDPYTPYQNPEDRDRMLELLKENGFVKNYEVARRHKNGSPYYSSLTITPFPAAGEGAILLMEIDITEQKRLEEEAKGTAVLRAELEKEKEITALKDRFISMVSHEFRTPLAVIKTCTDLLNYYGDRMTEDRKQKSLEQINQQISILSKLIDSVLSLSRTQAGKTEFAPTLINLESFCHAIFEQIQFTSPDHQFKFISTVPNQAKKIDDNLLQHILLNLLTNAVKYSPKNGQISIELEQDNNIIIIKVSDEGIGIPQEEQHRLFEPFHRASNVGNIDGTGLGLSIVKEYVELHSGRIDVESEVGKGSTFKISLPLI